MGIMSNMKEYLRNERIEKLEQEVASAKMDEPLPRSWAYLGLLVWTACSGAVGFSLWCIGEVFPVLHLHDFFLILASVGLGTFLFYCIGMAVVGGAGREHSEKEAELTALRYEALREEGGSYQKVGKKAYQARSSP